MWTSIRRFASSATPQRQWTVYLSGEIHSPWRAELAEAVSHLPVTLTGPNDDHALSDDAGAMIYGAVPTRPHWDSLGARLNGLRTTTNLKEADLVVVKFGEKYRQWNAAFEAGYASALNIPIITIHPPNLSHMLKEVNAHATMAVDSVEKVAAALDYTINGTEPAAPKDWTPSEDIWGKGNPNPGGK
ncbi:hypothetical protein TrST_g3210 [Triparma strigata]|uniref:YtoQ family protein n=1 Tax=Triparma strigata TaxID=1606541 RepID=A0A9W7AIN0_9STRA|nr:hypothetical protein TrST_g3210 [Triparma strigata]